MPSDAFNGEVVELTYGNAAKVILEEDGADNDLSGYEGCKLVIGSTEILSDNSSNARIRWAQGGYSTGEVRISLGVATSGSGDDGGLPGEGIYHECPIAFYNATGTTKTISAATQASACQITTTTAHGLSTGDYVIITSVVGMTELNNYMYKVTVVDATNFTIGVDSTGFTEYDSAGTVTLLDDGIRWDDGLDIKVR